MQPPAAAFVLVDGRDGTPQAGPGLTIYDRETSPRTRNEDAHAHGYGDEDGYGDEHVQVDVG